VISPDVGKQGTNANENATDTPTNPFMTKQKIVKDRWICDICRTAAFDSFDDACLHEETCKGKRELLEAKATKASVEHEKDDLEINQPTIASISASTPTSAPAPEPASAPDVDFEKTPMLPKKLQFSAPSAIGNAAAPKPLPDGGCTFENCEICNDEQHSDERTPVKISKAKMANDTTKASRKSTRASASVSVSVSVSASASAKNIPTRTRKQANELSPEVQIIATKKPRTTSASASASLAPTAPLFLNQKSKGSSTGTTKAAAKKQVQTKVSKPTKKGGNASEKTPRTVAFASIFKKPCQTSDSSSSSSATTATEQEQKEILAEHRAAEFASKRRVQLTEERERQKKREKALQLKNEAQQKEKEEQQIQIQDKEAVSEKAQGPVASIFQKPQKEDSRTPKRRKTNSGTTLESPLDLTETPIAAIVPVKKLPAKKQQQKKAPNRADFRLFPPRFPNPSHVHNEESLDKALGSPQRSEEYEAFVASPRYQCSMDSASHPDLPLYVHGCEHSNDTSMIHQSDEADFLYSTFSSVLRPCTVSVDDADDGTTAAKQLWSDKYTMRALPHDVYGHTNKEVAEDLINFINDWKGHRQQVCDARAAKAAKLQGRKKKTKKKTKHYESEEDDFFSDEEDDGLRNVYLLTGVTGTGKTNLVQAAAKHCHCSLIEINTTMERGGKALKAAIEESTQSHSNFALLKRGNDPDAAGVLKEDDEDESSAPSVAVILIDEGKPQRLANAKFLLSAISPMFAPTISRSSF